MEYIIISIDKNIIKILDTYLLKINPSLKTDSTNLQNTTKPRVRVSRI